MDIYNKKLRNKSVQPVSINQSISFAIKNGQILKL